MAIKAKDIYRGRKKSNAGKWIIMEIVIAIILLVIGTFYLLRSFAVYDNEGNATIIFPWTDDEAASNLKTYDEAKSSEVKNRLDKTQSEIDKELRKIQVNEKSEEDSNSKSKEDSSSKDEKTDSTDDDSIETKETKSNSDNQPEESVKSEDNTQSSKKENSN